MQNREFTRSIVENKIISQEELDGLQMLHRGDDCAVLDSLIQQNPQQKQALCKIWGDAIGIACLDLDKTIVDAGIIKKLPQTFAKQKKIIPIYQLGGRITVAMADPSNLPLVREVEQMLGSAVSPVFSLPADIEDAAEIFYQSPESLMDYLNEVTRNPIFTSAKMVTEEQLQKLSSDQAVVEFTKGLLLLALKERCSDVHIEPVENMVRIRFRIDGVLQERMRLDLKILSAVITRLKVMANLNITEKRRPQDGRISLQLPNRSLDLRFSSVPALYGEKIVLRLLGKVAAKQIPDLSELSFSPANFNCVRKIAESPNGIFLVTGPTGSGKTTTLYSVLKMINKPGINIMTIEDPVEYRLSGINQIQVNPAINLDFSTALRSFLRQDPDVILVGEVRDLETAKIAAQAALTGHLVMTTMHTNNALQAVTRLVEIGVEPFLVAPAIIGVMAQRLVRRICEQCRESYPAPPELVDAIFIRENNEEVRFFRGRGCPQCNHTGYFGRLSIQEVLLIGDDFRGSIARGASIMEIQEMARVKGFRTMRYDGIKKVLRGLTTIEEVNRVTIVDDE